MSSVMSTRGEISPVFWHFPGARTRADGRAAAVATEPGQARLLGRAGSRRGRRYCRSRGHRTRRALDRDDAALDLVVHVRRDDVPLHQLVLGLVRTVGDDRLGIAR